MQSNSSTMDMKGKCLPVTDTLFLSFHYLKTVIWALASSHTAAQPVTVLLLINCKGNYHTKLDSTCSFVTYILFL